MQLVVKNARLPESGDASPQLSVDPSTVSFTRASVISDWNSQVLFRTLFFAVTPLSMNPNPRTRPYSLDGGKSMTDFSWPRRFPRSGKVMLIEFAVVSQATHESRPTRTTANFVPRRNIAPLDPLLLRLARSRS